ncbi:hypothetical protein ACFFSY_06040 [Paenibacillus aurantiacus]|uniref:Uncharacterized protein n=1 Tax=Paenibacillus aurantiacus TaxID=1936118 RepID=A0ABV5KJU6_9BACL
MRTLIELLLENIYIVIVVVGFLLSLLSKARKQGRGGRMPSFGGDPSSMRPEQAGSGRSREEEPPRMSDWEEDSAARTYGAPSDAPEASIPEVRKPVPTPRIPRKTTMPKPAVGGNLPSGTKAQFTRRQDGSFPIPSSDELKRAVVLAEVLGPPRSKRPLRRP